MYQVLEYAYVIYKSFSWIKVVEKCPIAFLVVSYFVREILDPPLLRYRFLAHWSRLEAQRARHVFFVDINWCTYKYLYHSQYYYHGKNVF